MNRLKELHWSRIFVLYGSKIHPLSSQQLLTLLQYQTGRKYNKKYLRDVHNKPFFWEFGEKLDIYFTSQLTLPSRQIGQPKSGS